MLAEDKPMNLNKLAFYGEGTARCCLACDAIQTQSLQETMA